MHLERLYVQGVATLTEGWMTLKGQPPKHPVESTGPIRVMGVDMCNPKMVVTPNHAHLACSFSMLPDDQFSPYHDLATHKIPVLHVFVELFILLSLAKCQNLDPQLKLQRKFSSLVL